LLIAHGFAPLAEMSCAVPQRRLAARDDFVGQLFYAVASGRRRVQTELLFFSGFVVFLKAYTSVILREEALDVCFFASFGRIVPPSMEG
jgi:hypothetical protein